MASWIAPTATDLVDGNVAVVASPVSGSVFPLGTTTVSLTSQDSRLNTATRSLTITIQDTSVPTATVTGAPPTINVTAATASTTTLTVPYAIEFRYRSEHGAVANLSVTGGATSHGLSIVGNAVTYTITAPAATWGVSSQGRTPSACSPIR